MHSVRCIDPLTCDVTFICIHLLFLYGGHHFECQNCIAVIERKVLIISLFANASDYSNKTCILCKIQAHRPVYASLVGVVTCIGEERHD